MPSVLILLEALLLRKEGGGGGACWRGRGLTKIFNLQTGALLERRGEGLIRTFTVF